MHGVKQNHDVEKVRTQFPRPKRYTFNYSCDTGATIMTKNESPNHQGTLTVLLPWIRNP